MTPRPPNQPRSGVKPAVVANGRGTSPLLPIVHQRMAADETWNFKSVNDLWICPFCLGGVAKRPGLSHPESISRHLENCRSFALGKGQVQPRERILERRAYENVVHAAQNDPAWKIYDNDGIWISPFSLQRVPAIRVTAGKLDNFLFQAIAKHLAGCGFYRQGIARTADEVLLARELHRRIADVGSYVDYQLHTQTGWRFVDADGSWICPFTLYAAPQIRIATAEDWPVAAQSIALHLITHCPRFATGQVQPHPDGIVAQAAGPRGRCLPPPSTPSPNPVSPTQILGTTTRHGLALLSPTPTDVAVLPPNSPHRQVAVAPPVATPVGGTSARATLFNRTPDHGSATVPAARPVAPAAGIVPPLAQPIGGPPPASVPAARVITQPAQSVVAPVVAPPAAPEASGGLGENNLGWMDEADPGGFETVRETPRTDMIHARKLQEKLLQQAPEIPGFRIATRFEACEDITGDFFVFIPLEDGRTGFALGDVSGHGVQAGLIMSMAKKTLEIYAAQGHGPADTLARVNDALVSDLGGKMFISMFYAVLDPTANTITWARAGHNPGLGYNPTSDRASEIKPRGMVVGMKSGAIFRQSLEEEITRLESGDLFLLYTDGITETMNMQGDEFGTDRLSDILRQFSVDGPEAVVEQIMDRLRHFRGPRPAADDATMVALLVE